MFLKYYKIKFIVIWVGNKLSVLYEMNHIWKRVQSASKHIYISNLELCSFSINKKLKAFSTTLNIIFITLEEIIVFLKLNTLIEWMLLPKMWNYKTSPNIMGSVLWNDSHISPIQRSVLRKHNGGTMLSFFGVNEVWYWSKPGLVLMIH